MLPIRIKACSESDLRMLGDLAHNIQRVLPVTQADIDAAAALGKGWVVWKVVEVTDPLDNCRGGTQLVIKQNSIQPGQNVRRVLIVSGPSGQVVVVGPDKSPLLLPDAVADSLQYLKAYGDCENRNLPEGYQELEYIEGVANVQYINTGIVMNSNMEIYCKAEPLRVISTGGGSYTPFGARDTASGNAGFVTFFGPINTNMDWWDSTRWTEAHGYADGFPATVIEISVKNSLATLKYDGNTKTHQFTPTLTTTSATMWINGLNNGGTPWTTTDIPSRIYRFTITGIADMRPARRLSDGVVGMYDTIRKRFFTNAGTGSFTAGTPLNALPDGYTQLEYLQSTGTQYIDTGIQFSSYPFKKVITFSDAVQGSGASSLPNWVNGSWANDSNNRSGGIGLKTNGKIGLGIGTTGLGSSPYEIDNPATPTTVNIEVLSSTSAKFTGGSTDYNSITYSGGALSGYTDYLFGAHFNGTTPTWAAGVKIYGAKYYNNDVLVREFIPAKRNSDGVLGMYDMVSGTFFTNAGTGTFTAGGVITPTPTKPADIWCNNGAIKAIRPIKYLESTGTQYIDTGVVPSINTKLVVKALARDITTGQIAGCRPAVNENNLSLRYANDSGVASYFADFNNSAFATYRAGYPTSTPSDVILEASKAKRAVYAVDGTILAENTTEITDTFNFTLSMYLFGVNGMATLFSGRIYSAQIYDGATLIRDMIPALDANNIPCMFDKVEGKCYYNAGTGQFIAGYLPADYEELEYIQSSGLEYINTGLTVNQNTEIDAEWQRVDLTAGFLYGIIRTGNTDVVSAYLNTTSTVAWRFSSDSINPVDNGFLDTNWHHTIQNKNGVTADGVLKAYTSVADFQTTEVLPIFCRYNVSTSQFMNGSSVRIKRFQIRQSGTTAAVMIPARKRSNGHIGMYDLVRRQFFENAGEGQFTFGKLPILPETYTQLEYLESTGTQWLETGVSIAGGCIIEAKAKVMENQFIIGSQVSGQPDTTRCRVYFDGANQGLLAQKLNVTATLAPIADTSQPFEFKMDTIGTGFYFYVNGSLIYSNASSGTIGSQTNNGIKIAYNNATSTAYKQTVYWVKIYDSSNVLVRYLIPAKRNSDSVVGMYDIMNDVFLTNQGTGTFAYGAEIPTETFTGYYVDGVIEKVGTRSASNKNLFNGVFEQGGLYQGNLVVADTRIRTPDYLTFPAGTYTISCASAYEVWIEKNDTSSVNWYSSYTFTATSTDKFKIAVRSKTDPSTTIIRPDDPVNVQVEAGSTATAYVPYCDGGLAVCENLLGIGSTQDVQEILTGEVTRKVGVFVLTGAEWWEKLNFADKSVFRAKVVIPADRYSNPENNIGLCSHFTVIPTSAGVTSAMNNLELAWNTNSLMCIRYDSMSTLNDFLAFLRSQYDAGTPVTIVYPLSADETELVAGQTLTVSAGNNTAEIIQASIDGLMLEAEYTKSV